MRPLFRVRAKIHLLFFQNCFGCWRFGWTPELDCRELINTSHISFPCHKMHLCSPKKAFPGEYEDVLLWRALFAAAICRWTQPQSVWAPTAVCAGGGASLRTSCSSSAFIFLVKRFLAHIPVSHFSVVGQAHFPVEHESWHKITFRFAETSPVVSDLIVSSQPTCLPGKVSFF